MAANKNRPVNKTFAAFSKLPTDIGEGEIQCAPPYTIDTPKVSASRYIYMHSLGQNSSRGERVAKVASNARRLVGQENALNVEWRAAAVLVKRVPPLAPPVEYHRR